MSHLKKNCMRLLSSIYIIVTLGGMRVCGWCTKTSSLQYFQYYFFKKKLRDLHVLRSIFISVLCFSSFLRGLIALRTTVLSTAVPQKCCDCPRRAAVGRRALLEHVSHTAEMRGGVDGALTLSFVCSGEYCFSCSADSAAACCY